MTSSNSASEPDEEKSEEFRRACIHLTRRFMPGILSALLDGNKLDRNRIGDHDYVWSVIRENIDSFKDFHVIYIIDDEFVASAKSVAAEGHDLAAIVLIATALENKINVFYREILERHHGIGSDEATQVIRSNTESKIGWLFHLVSGRELAEDLKQRIRQVHQWRNSIIHYKAIACHLDDDLNMRDRILSEIGAVGMDNIIKLPLDLEDALTEVRLDVIELLEESLKLAQAILPEEEG